MAFTRETNITITGRGDIGIVLFEPGPDNTNGVRAGEIEMQLLRSDGSIKPVKANLLARLGDDAEGLTHRANLLDLLDYIITRIETEVLP